MQGHLLHQRMRSYPRTPRSHPESVLMRRFCGDCHSHLFICFCRWVNQRLWVRCGVFFLAYRADDGQLFSCPICVLCRQVARIQDGAEFSGVRMYVPAENLFFSSDRNVMSSLKFLWEIEKDGSYFSLGRGICVWHLQLETEMTDTLDMAGGVLVSLRRWSISFNSVSTVSIYL